MLYKMPLITKVQLFEIFICQWQDDMVYSGEGNNQVVSISAAVLLASLVTKNFGYLQMLVLQSYVIYKYTEDLLLDFCFYDIVAVNQ